MFKKSAQVSLQKSQHAERKPQRAYPNIIRLPGCNILAESNEAIRRTPKTYP